MYFAGAVLGCLGLAAFSRAVEGWQVAAVWALLLGPAMACVFYEPAYVGIGQWFGERQGKPLGLLTLVAELSVTVFLPLTQWLVGLLSWRGAVLTLGLVLFAVVGPSRCSSSGTGPAPMPATRRSTPGTPTPRCSEAFGTRIAPSGW